MKKILLFKEAFSKMFVLLIKIEVQGWFKIPAYPAFKTDIQALKKNIYQAA